MPKHKRKPEKVKFTGLWIPADLVKMQKINALEKILLADIAYLGKKNGYRIGNETIARKLGAKHRTVVFALQRLKGFGYITDSGPNKSHRCLAIGEPIAALFETKHKTKAEANIALAKEPVKSEQTSDSIRLAELLLSEIRKRIPDFKRPNLQTWAKHTDLLIRLDNRKPERIAAVIRWCQADNGNGRWSGWQDNILSTKKLRDKFDKLGRDMDREKNGSNKVSRELAESSAIGIEVDM